MTGNKYGMLTVIQRASNSNSGLTRWICKCDCGKETIVTAGHLKDGHTQSCGCLHKKQEEIFSTYQAVDITGKRYGRLVVVNKVGKDKNGKILWNCQCDCGNNTIASTGTLNNGSTKSCGCLHSELLSKRNTTHGYSKSSTYVSWQGMFRRCYNVKNPDYKNYGARGITVCRRWHIFSNFLDDMGEKPDKMSIDRINVNGNYCKSNCRWATSQQQANNTRQNVYIQYQGEFKTIAQWAREKGIKYHTLYGRLYRGCTLDELFKEVKTVCQ